jgi:hypothetical protein
MSKSRIGAIVLILLAHGACHAFDIVRYVQDHNASHDFATDVNEAKREILDGKLHGLYALGQELNAIAEVFRDMQLRPAHDRVRVTASVVPILYHDPAALSKEKGRVVGRMIAGDTIQKLGRYGIDVVDDLAIPRLSLQVFVKDREVSGQIVYAMNVSAELNEVLSDSATHLRVIASSCCGKQLQIPCVLNMDNESAPCMMGRSYQPERSRHETQVDPGTVLRFH